ncbi:MAG: enoyl-CoA hydratase/isomerase family protein [Acidobacteriota bacterium]
MIDSFKGQTLSWELQGSTLEVALHHPPCNEIGSVTLDELDRLSRLVESADLPARALIIYSSLASGFSAGADLRELFTRIQALDRAERARGVRTFIERIHEVFDRLDACPLVTIAAVHGVVFGGGFELALTCDMIVADRTARFCFPELRLGLIPGFGGIPRLKRDIGNSLIRDILLTGRSVNSSKAAAVGLVSQLVAPGEALRVARTVANQVGKVDAPATRAAKTFIKPVPREELHREIEIFCDLFNRPEVEAALRKFVESTDVQPYLP